MPRRGWSLHYESLGILPSTPFVSRNRIQEQLNTAKQSRRLEPRAGIQRGVISTAANFGRLGRTSLAARFSTIPSSDRTGRILLPRSIQP